VRDWGVGLSDSKNPKAADTQANSAAGAIPEGELDKVTGGIVRKAGERPVEFLTSQSTGAGAGKVTFNP
jgi:hypothetical protein